MREGWQLESVCDAVTICVLAILFCIFASSYNFFYMKQLNRIKVVLVEQNKTAKWLLIHVEKQNNSINLQ